MPKSEPWIAWVQGKGSILGLLLPCLTFVPFLPSHGALPSNDYYGVLEHVAVLPTDGTLPHYTTDLWRWLDLRSNEHHVALPVLLWAGNHALTGGDNRVLSILGIVCQLVVARLLFLLVPAPAKARPWAAFVIQFALAALLVTPAVAHNVVLGFSGSFWLLANALAVAALWAQQRALARAAFPWLALGLCLLGAWTYSTTLALWPILLALTLAYRDRGRDLVPLAACGGLVLAFHGFGYQRPDIHPAPTHGVLDVAHYALSYLGGPLAVHDAIAAAAGWVGCALLVVGTLVVLGTTAAAPAATGLGAWLGLAALAAINALGTAIARAGFGPGQALAPRYACVALLFWAAVLAVSGLAAWRSRSGSSTWRVLHAAFAIVVLVLVWLRGAVVYEGYLQRASLQPLAAQALRLGVDDDEALGILTPVPEQLRRVVPFLRATGHVPFRGGTARRSGEVLAPESRGAAPPPGLQGMLLSLRPLDSGWLRADGWVRWPGRRIEGLVVTDETGRILGEMVLSLCRPELAEVLGPEYLAAAFSGYLRAPATRDSLRVYARGAGSGPWWPMAETSSTSGGR